MATVSPEQVKSHPLGHRNCRIYKWDGFAAGDTLVPLPVGGYSDITVYFYASGFGAGAGWEVSPDPDDNVAYVTAVDAHDGSAISGKTSVSAWQVLTRGYFGRPTAGAGLTGGTCWLVLNSTK